MESRIRSLAFLLVLLLVSIPAVVLAQEPAPTNGSEEDPVLQALRQVEDETRPITFRSQLVLRLLMDRDPRAVEGLVAILESPDRPADLRLAVATAILAAPGYPGLDALVATTGDAGDESLRAELRRRFYWARSPGLVRELRRRALAAGAPDGDRVSAVMLLGATGSREAAEALLLLWEKGSEAVRGVAPEALFEIVPVPFDDLPVARKFFLEDHAGEDIETILRDRLRAARNGGGHSALRRLERMATALLESASLPVILSEYLGCAESPVVRRLGVERLRSFPYGKDGEATTKERRGQAASAVLDLLEREDDAQVLIALLPTLRSLVASVREVGRERAVSALMARVDSPLEGVPTEAVSAVGEMGDRSVIPELCRQFEQADPGRTRFRVAILDALDKLGNGISRWVLARLEEEGEPEGVVLRLVQLLKKDPGQEGTLPVLVRLLESSSSARVRTEAAIALGALGVRNGDRASIDALAVTGLADPDPSVRAISATQLGSAPEADGKVIELLRERLKEVETVTRVKTAAAWALLKLRGNAALPWLVSWLPDDEFWKEAFRNYLTVDVLPAGRAGEAETFVAALAEAEAWGRCAEAARRVLDAQDLPWEGPAAGGRARVLLLLVDSLARSKPAEALAVLTAEEAGVKRSGDIGIRLDLLKASLLRETGAVAAAVELLGKVLATESLPTKRAMTARLELARCHLASGEREAAERVLEPVLADPDLGSVARELLEQERSGGEAKPPTPVENLIRDLDSGEEPVRATAVAELKKRGPAAWTALVPWLDGKGPDRIGAALKTIAAITGIQVAWDPEASEEDRAKVLDDIRRRLGAGE